jgi:hypothetical protein
MHDGLCRLRFPKDLTMKRIHLLLILLAFAASVASASTIQLNQNNLGIAGSIGSVTLTQQSGGVMVTLSANAGYSFKLSGGDILFNTNSKLAASLGALNIQGILIDGKYTSNFS